MYVIYKFNGLVMELSEQLFNLKERIISLKDNVETEEATKTALIMPFIQILGYDVFNPLEVIPEFVADISQKKGEKVDYCIQKDGEPIIIIECKHWKENLDLHNTQLERYFSFTKAKFGILTNGIQYRIYTDLDNENKMDEKPFLEIDFENLKDSTINELKKFHKKTFDINKIIDSAGELKYYNEIKTIFEKELQEPSVELVKYFSKQVYSGLLTAKVVDQFSKIVKKAINHKINETINERLKAALSNENQKQEKYEDIEDDKELLPSEKIIFEDEEKGIVTTQEEIDGYNIVVDILKECIEESRIVYRDTKSYLGILLDDNNRQPICRLYFNRSKKYIGVFNSEKKEEKLPVEKIEHIYKYSDKIVKSANNYEKSEID